MAEASTKVEGLKAQLATSETKAAEASQREAAVRSELTAVQGKLAAAVGQHQEQMALQQRQHEAALQQVRHALRLTVI
jgi:hypothetical protein